MAARDEIREDMEVIGADQDHHHYLSLGLVAAVEGDKVRLSANAGNAALFEEEQDGSAA
jgi:hypothetical protein